VTEQRSVEADDPETVAPRLEDDFGYAIGVVFRAYAKALEAAVGDLPAGPRGYFVLAAAVEGKAGSQRSLAERLGVDRTVMTYLLDELEEAGLVERKPDPADRRSRNILATERGTKLSAELRGRVSLIEQHILDPLPEESREQFRAMLCVLAGHVTTGNAVANACRLVEEFSASE
jgi:DNA-binding MarR family transcriptional regulator